MLPAHGILLHGAMARCSSDFFLSGTTSAGSKLDCIPSPSHTGQAPYGLLKENSRGSISDKVKPETGQANFEDRVKECSNSEVVSSISDSFAVLEFLSANSTLS